MNKHLVVLDFDRTIAETFHPSQNGIDVESASKMAVKEMFGRVGLKAYDALGGLRGREPGELIKELQMLLGFEMPLIEATQRYVDLKMSQILPEICLDWPPLLPGVRDFFIKVEQGVLPIDIAIVSSGHDEPIKKVFETNGLRVPENLVTSDGLRRRSLPPQRDRFKPHTFQLAEAHFNWEAEVRRNASYSDGAKIPHSKDKIIYVGDDPIKDGLLALNARIPFVYIPQSENGFNPDERKGQLQLEDFEELSLFILASRNRLKAGESFSRIFFGREYGEIFPPLDPESRPFNKWMEARRGDVNGSPERF